MREPETGRVCDVEFITIGTLHLVESCLINFTRDYEKYERHETNENYLDLFVCFVIFFYFATSLLS